MRAQPSSESRSDHHARVMRVLEVTEAGALAVAPLNRPAAPQVVRCALPAGTTARPGDEVVVLECGAESIAIARVAARAPEQVALRDGTSVEIDRDATRVSVRRADGSEMFRYEVEAARGTITIEAESLALCASGGDLRLQAAGEVQLSGQRMQARASRADGIASTWSLTPRRSELHSQRIAWQTEQLDVAAQRTQLSGQELRTVLARAVLQVERVETVSDVVMQTARNVYTHVRELLQERAGSLRTLVDGTAQLRARDIAQRAEDAYKLRAEKIHLG
jgi:lipopolysaccharide export system protein LptA